MNQPEQDQNLLPKIVFNNEPKLSEHEVDQEYNERRLRLSPLIKEFIFNHKRFEGKEVKVNFSHRGVSSVVSIIETPDERVVLKVTLSLNYSSGEGPFLKVWEEAGVRVPHVIENGTIGGHAYVLMEYIDAEPLSEKFNNEQLVNEGYVLEMGQILHTMHETKTKGYGRFRDKEGKAEAEFQTFKEWLDSELVKDRIDYVKEKDLLGKELQGILPLALKILTELTDKDRESSYCHDDFGAGNIFATKPLTVFDPNPRFNHPYLDLGRTIAITISGGKYEGAVSQLIEGYFAGEKFDNRALQASILLNCCLKFRYWDLTKKTKRIKNLQDYLIKNKAVLIS
jgi:fructosamine-3-kinase